MQPRERIDRMHRQLGRRGAFLLAWGILFVLYGFGFWFAPLPEHPHNQLIVHEYIPHQVRAVVWVLSGLVADVSAFRRSPGRDTIGFVAILIMPMIRSASYGFSALAWIVTASLPDLFVHTYGDPRGYVSAVFYLVFVASVIIVSGFHEDHGYAPPPDRGRAQR